MSEPIIAPAIAVQGVEKSYGKLSVLRGVDFEVAPGSIFALLGSNGAGKTTLVRILSTLLKADAGAARVNGVDVATQPAQVRESISLTGQFAAVDETLTGRENLILVARLRHLKDPGAIADDLLARFALTDAGGRRVGEYSGGMRRRLDIAMSLIGDPPVVFLDEPTTGLDPESVDGASAILQPLIFLPFISSAFVPTASMPGPVRWFAEHQPVTSIVNTLRALFAQQPVGSDIWVALAWCVGISAAAYVAAMIVYRRRIA